MSEIQAPFNDPRTAELSRRINAIDSEIFDEETDLDVRTSTLNRMEEARFIRDFLPVFSGKVTTGVHEAQQAWAAWAGSLFKAVLLVDASGNGVRIVPPLKSSNLFPLGERKVNLRDVVDHAQRVDTPQVADTLISTELNGSFQISDDKGNEILKERWDAFLENYGVVPSVKAAPQPGVSPGYENVEIVYD